MLKNIAEEISKTREKYFLKTQGILEARRGKNGDNPMYREIEQERIHTNFIRTIPASIALIVIEGSGMLWALITKITFNYASRFFFAFLAFFILSIFLIFLINRELKRSRHNDRRKRRMYLIYWTIYMFQAVAYSVMELFDRGTINNYLAFLAVFTLLPILEPVTKAFYYIIAAAIEITVLVIVHGKASYIIVAACITVFAQILSFIRFYYYISDKITTKRLEYSANGDALTGIINRRGFRSRFPYLESFCRSNGYTLCIMMVDIDDFKKYNDTYGHLKGDKCLIAVASGLRDGFSRPTDICARYGGEEFVVATAQKDVESFLNYVAKLISEISLREIDPAAARITVSAGVYAVDFEKDGDLTLAGYVEKADEQLYNAKKSGKNCLSCENRIYKNQGA